MSKLKNFIEMTGTDQVIVRSNEDEPLRKGTLVKFEKIGNIKVPIVLIDGEKLLCMGVVIPYTEEMWNFLNGLDPRRQWEILSGISSAVQSLKKK